MTKKHPPDLITLLVLATGALGLAIGAFVVLVFGSSWKPHSITAMAQPDTIQSQQVAFNPPTDIPDGPIGEAIKKGQALYNNTPAEAGGYVGNKMSCSSCHAGGGMQQNALPLVGITTQFPAYTNRDKKVISLEDRINECFVRSEAGKPLPTDSEQMTELVAYLNWISTGVPSNTKLPWRGNGAKMATSPKPNVENGKQLYANTCATCHGQNGEGISAPPLWGPNSFAMGAGMSTQAKMQGFIKAVMPLAPMNGINPGGLTDQQAADITAYVLTHDRPKIKQP